MVLHLDIKEEHHMKMLENFYMEINLEILEVMIYKIMLLYKELNQ